jgi:hypothetical protein
VLSDEELRRLLATCAGRDFTARRDNAIIMLFLDDGLRLSELADLQVADVDLRDRIVYVAGKASRRSGPRHRAVPLGVKAARALDRYLREVGGTRTRTRRGCGLAVGADQFCPPTALTPCWDAAARLLRFLSPAGQPGQLWGPQEPVAATNSTATRPRPPPQRAGTLRASSRSHALTADQTASTPKPKLARLTRANTAAAKAGRVAPPAEPLATTARTRAVIAVRARPLSPEARAVRSGATGRTLFRMRSCNDGSRGVPVVSCRGQ